MANIDENDISFVRLTDIAQEEILEHMTDPRVSTHLPLLKQTWSLSVVAQFVKDKEESWQRDGLGHWAILYRGNYVGWGGFQKEGDEWDYGLVLKPAYFGWGWAITQHALEFAKADSRILVVTFLLPPSRKSQKALIRLGAEFVGEVIYKDMPFFKYHFDTHK